MGAVLTPNKFVVCADGESFSKNRFAKWLPPEVFAIRFFNYAYFTLIAGTGGYSFDEFKRKLHSIWF